MEWKVLEQYRPKEQIYIEHQLQTGCRLRLPSWEVLTHRIGIISSRTRLAKGTAKCMVQRDAMLLRGDLIP